jgi:hypothetical protein
MAKVYYARAVIQLGLTTAMLKNILVKDARVP